MKRMVRLNQDLGDSGAQKEAASRKDVRHTVARMRQSIETEYGGAAAEHARLVRLSVNEAEAIAWQTEFPHLFFPLLAEEKAQAALSWHHRQRAVRRRSGEVAFAE